MKEMIPFQAHPCNRHLRPSWVSCDKALLLGINVPSASRAFFDWSWCFSTYSERDKEFHLEHFVRHPCRWWQEATPHRSGRGKGHAHGIEHLSRPGQIHQEQRGCVSRSSAGSSMAPGSRTRKVGVHLQQHHTGSGSKPQCLAELV